MKVAGKREIIGEILKDHKTLKALLREGLRKDIIEKDSNLNTKKRIFEELAIVLTAYGKGEEAALYAPTCRMDETKKNAFLGFEEHELMELLMEEMKSETNFDRWEAKFTVICEMLEAHIESEEEKYFPLVDEIFSKEERISMGKEYRETFERLESAQRQISHPFSDRKRENH